MTWAIFACSITFWFCNDVPIETGIESLKKCTNKIPAMKTEGIHLKCDRYVVKEHRHD